MSLKKRIEDLVSSVSADMLEREEIVAVSLLSALCGQNTFLLGPPGTAKSLISRRIAHAFEHSSYFEYLMNRFSTPEEVFGPVSIKALKEDRYVRKTDSYLPKADFAFLDEIWKSSPAILNTLLTLINEHTFRNGDEIQQASIKALIAASNETPDREQGLEALYDRFIVRLFVKPIQQPNHFDRLLESKPTLSMIDVNTALRITESEWMDWRKYIYDVKLSSETLIIVHLIREQLFRQSETLAIYVSDRRWQRAAILMKASAFFNDRQETNHSDALLLQHCLWSHESNRIAIRDIVTDAVKAAGLETDIDLHAIDNRKDDLDREIHDELYYSSDIYKTTNIGGREFFHHIVDINDSRGRAGYEKRINIYIPVEKTKSTDTFNPIDRQGNEIESVKCQFDGQGSCMLEIELEGGYYSTHPKKEEFVPEPLFHKGDKKGDVNMRLISSLAMSVSELGEELKQTLKCVQEKFRLHASKLSSTFVSEEQTNMATAGIAEQIDGLQLRIKDCERLEHLCR